MRSFTELRAGLGFEVVVEGERGEREREGWT